MLHGWTVQQLSATIAAEKPQPARPLGRPPKSPVLKWLGGVRTAAGQARDPVEFAADFAKLDDVAKAAALAQMQALREEIDGLLAVLGG